MQVAGSVLVWGDGVWERAGEEEGVIALGDGACARAMGCLRAGDEAGDGADLGRGMISAVRNVVCARVGVVVGDVVEGGDVFDSRARTGVAFAAGAEPEAKSQLPGPAAALSAPDRSFPNVCVQ